MPARGGKIKRTKTFTGCSTCRSRGVKCGEEKPTCLRCRNMALECGGYGVTLVWPGSKEPKASQRRVMLTGLESSVKVMSDEEILSILSTIDSDTPVTDFNAGLFGVFSASRRREAKATCEDFSHIVPLMEPSSEDSLSTNQSIYTALTSTAHKSRVSYAEIRRKTRAATMETLKWRLGLTFLEPSLYDSMPIKCKEGRELMHYWVTHLSPIMIPTERLDNPFTSIIVPLASRAVGEYQNSSGSRALLYSVYSLTAFSQSSCSSFSTSMRKRQHALGSTCLQVALEELGRSLEIVHHGDPEATLATVLILVLIGIFTDNYSNYRIHIKGGAEWTRSIDKSIWRHNHDASALYQLFTGLEAFRPVHGILARDLGPQDLSLEYLSLDKADDEARLLRPPAKSLADTAPSMALSDTGTGSYCLDKVFALTRPILECIMQINRLIFAGVTPADGEFVSLEFKIMSSNPDLRHFPSLTPVSEKVAHHHACTLWCALYIYYKSSVLILPPNDMQWLVRQSIEHLKSIELLTEGLTCSGFLWPLFITACEAEDEDLRVQSIKVFEKRQKLGIANVTAARRVVDELWRRRDQGATGVSWHEVMAQLNIDILLS